MSKSFLLTQTIRVKGGTKDNTLTHECVTKTRVRMKGKY